MFSAEDESSSVLNGRLRPRKSTATIPNPPIKATYKNENKVAQDKPKRNSTPSKALPNKQADLTAKADSPVSPIPQLLCPYCDKKFITKLAASKHARRIHLSTSKQDRFIGCLFCNHSDAESNDIIHHMVDSHPNQYFACLDCHTRFPSTAELATHKLNVCEKQKQAYRSKLRKKTSPISKEEQKKLPADDNTPYPVESNEAKHEPEFNGLVISCELKPSQGNEEVDIEDKITTNLILPSNKALANSVLEKNAVIILDDIQWRKRIPPNFSFHNADADQILSRLGVVHRSPRVGESTRREWLKMIDDSGQKFEKCFDTNFYSRVASNVHENLARFVDGTFNFSPDPDKVIKTRKSKSSAIINTAEGFPILLPYEQYSRNRFDGYMPRAIAPKHKWKWDSTENEKHIIIDTNVMKRDNHVNQCIITLVSSLDIWTQLRMRHKFEGIFFKVPTEKMEKQNIIGRELKEILESREIPCSSSQVVEYTSKPEFNVTQSSDFPSLLGLAAKTQAPAVAASPAVLSGEWVRPRCYVCCACGDQTRDSRTLTAHMASQHPNAQVQHYDIVGESLLNADILKHLYVPPSQMSNRTRPLRGFRDCTKCKKSITLEDLHQHMLDCAGDTPTVRRKVRSRPFGVRRRRPRLPDTNTIRKKIRKDIRNRQNQNALLRARPRIRTEVGDAETIRKMLADLPAKRHRQVAGHPTHHVLRPRRKIEKQRSKLKIKRLATNEGTIKARSRSDTLSQSQIDEDDKPLKPSVKLAPENTITAKKRFSSRLSKHNKKSPTEKADTTSDEAQQNASGSSSAAQPQQLSSENSSHSLNGDGSTNDRRELGNNESSKNQKTNDHGEKPGDEPDRDNPNDSAEDATILKHSINSITASSDSLQQPRQDSLPLQENGGASARANTQNILENETIASKPDKPPLSTNLKHCSKKIQRPLHLKLQSLSNCIEKIAKSKKQSKEDTMFHAADILKDKDSQTSFEVACLPLLDPNPAVICSSRDESGTVVNVTPAKILSRQTMLPQAYTEQHQVIENERHYRRCSETVMQRQPVERLSLPPRNGTAGSQRKSSDSDFTPPRTKAPSKGRRRKSFGTRSSFSYNDYEQANVTAKLLQQPHPYGLFPNFDPHAYLRVMEQNICHPSVEGMVIPELLQLQYREMQEMVKNSHLHRLPPLNIGFTAPGLYTPDMVYENTRANVTRLSLDTAPQLMFNVAQPSPILSPVSPRTWDNDGTRISQLNNNYSISTLLPMETSPTNAVNPSATRRTFQKRVSESSETDVYGNCPMNSNEITMQLSSESRSTHDVPHRSSETATLVCKPPMSEVNKEFPSSFYNKNKNSKAQKELNSRAIGSDFVTLPREIYGRNFETASNTSDVSGSSYKSLQDRVEDIQSIPLYPTSNSVQDLYYIPHPKEKSHDTRLEYGQIAAEGSQDIGAKIKTNKIEKQKWAVNTANPLSSFPATLPANIMNSSSTNQIRNSIENISYNSTYGMPDHIYREQNYQDASRDPGDSEIIEQPLDLSGKNLPSLCKENALTASADDEYENKGNSDTENPEPVEETYVTIDLSIKNRESVREKSNENEPEIYCQQLDDKKHTSPQIESQVEHRELRVHVPTELSPKERLDNIPKNKEIKKFDEQNVQCRKEANSIDVVPAMPHNTTLDPKINLEIAANSGFKRQQVSRRHRYKSESDIIYDKTYHTSVISPTALTQNNFKVNVNLDLMDHTDKVTPANCENIRKKQGQTNNKLRSTKPADVSFDDHQTNVNNVQESSVNNHLKITNSERNKNTKDVQTIRFDWNNDNKFVSFEDKTAYAREILSILFNYDPDIERKTVTLPKELVELLYIVPRDQILKYLRVIPSYLEHIMTENTPLINGQDITGTMKLIVAKLFEFLKQLYMIKNDEVKKAYTSVQDLQDTTHAVEISAAFKILAFLEQLVMTKNNEINTPFVIAEDPQNVTHVEEILCVKILSFLRKLILIKKYAVNIPFIRVTPAIDDNMKPACDIFSNENRLTINTVPSSSILPKKRHSPSARLNSQEAYYTTQSWPSKQPQRPIIIPSMPDITPINSKAGYVRNDTENLISSVLKTPEHSECDSKENISKIIDLTDDDHNFTNQAITNTGYELLPKLQVTQNATGNTASLRAVRIKSPWSRKSISDDKQLPIANSEIDSVQTTYDLIQTDRPVTLTSSCEMSSFNSVIDNGDKNLHQNNKGPIQIPISLSDTTKENFTQIEQNISSFRSTNQKVEIKIKESVISNDKKQDEQVEIKLKLFSSEKTSLPVIERNNVMAPVTENIAVSNYFMGSNKSQNNFLVHNGTNSYLHDTISITEHFISNKENDTIVKTMLKSECRESGSIELENGQKMPIDVTNKSIANIETIENISTIQRHEDEESQKDIVEVKQPLTKYSDEEDSEDNISLAVIVKQRQQEYTASTIETKVSTKSSSQGDIIKLTKKERKLRKKSHKTHKSVSTDANLEKDTINVTLNNIVNEEEPMVVDLNNLEEGKNVDLYSKSYENSGDAMVNLDMRVDYDINIRKENSVSDIRTKSIELNNIYDIHINNENEICGNVNKSDEYNKVVADCKLSKNTVVAERCGFTRDKNGQDSNSNALKLIESLAAEDITFSQAEEMASYTSRRKNKNKLTDKSVLPVKSQATQSDLEPCPNLTQKTSPKSLSEPDKKLSFLDENTSIALTQNISLERESPQCDTDIMSTVKHRIKKPELVEAVETLQRSDFSTEFKDSNKRALRRSGRRGKSMFSDEKTVEDYSQINDETIPNTPFTKKQLIFSKYLMEENHHCENDIGLLPNTQNDNESTTCMDGQKSESIKCKKSLITKIQSNKNKFSDHIDETETISNCSMYKNTGNSDENESKKSGSDNCDVDSVGTDKDSVFEFEDDVRSMNSKEKRKLNKGTLNDTDDSTKPKRTKTNINLDKSFKLEAPENKTRNIIAAVHSHEEMNGKESNINVFEITKSSSFSEIKTACYNRNITDKQMGLSAAVPVKNLENYDPYDINLEVMAETSQPILKWKSNKVNVGIKTKTTKKYSITEDTTTDIIEKEIELDDLVQAVDSALPCVSDSDSSVNDVPLQKYVEEKEKMKSYDIAIPNISGVCEKILEQTEPALQKPLSPNEKNELCSKNIYLHINDNHGELSHVSDARIEDTSQSTNLIDYNNTDKNVSNTVGIANNYTVDKSNRYPDQNEDDKTEKSAVKTNVKQKRNRRSLTYEKTESMSIESDQQLSSDKYMENFGFYSVRKPRKSNLLASKKISETFHMIENDDAFFSSKSRQRKSSHNENKKAPNSDCCLKTTQATATTTTEQDYTFQRAMTPTPQIEVEENNHVNEQINYDEEVDLATAQKILESEEIRRLENELIVGFKEAAEANAGKTSGFNYLRAEEPISREHVVQDMAIPVANVMEERIEIPECSKKPNKGKQKTQRPPEYKEMMYPDEEVNIYEDKYDIIKRRRTQAAAAKQLQNVDEPRTITKAKKKTERKSSNKKCSKKPMYQVSQVPTKGALKGFDGIKISIPTQDLNMPPNVSPPHNQPKNGRTNKKRKNGIQKTRDRKVSGSSSKSESDNIKDDESPSKRDIYEFEDDERPVLPAYRLARVFDQCRNPSSDIEEEDQEVEVEGNSKTQYIKDQTTRNNSDDDDEFALPKVKKCKRKGKGKQKNNVDNNKDAKAGTSGEQGKRSRKEDKEIDINALSYGLKPEKTDKLSNEYNRTNLEDSDIDDQMLPGTSNFMYRDDESSYESDSSAPAPLIGRNFDGAFPCTCASPTEIESDDSDIERGCANSACRYNPGTGAKNLVMGKIFKNNAVRCDKSDDPPQDPPPSPKPKPDLDLLFDSLLEKNTNNTTSTTTIQPSTSKPTSSAPGPSSSTQCNSESNIHTSPEINDDRDLSNVDDGFSSPNRNGRNQISKNNYSRGNVTSLRNRHSSRANSEKTSDDVYNLDENSDDSSDDDNEYIRKSKKHDRTEESLKKHRASPETSVKSTRQHLPDNPKKSNSKQSNGNPKQVSMNNSFSSPTKRSRSDVEISSTDDELNTVKSKRTRKVGKKPKSHHKRNKDESEDESNLYDSKEDIVARKVKNRPSYNREEEHDENLEDRVNDRESNRKRPPSRKSDEGISTSHDNSADAFDLPLPGNSGVAVQRARRKCTVGKQNVLAEHWSSSDSESSGSDSADSTNGGRRRKTRKPSVGKKSNRVIKKRDSNERAGPSRVGPQPKIRARPATCEPDNDNDNDNENQNQNQNQNENENDNENEDGNENENDNDSDVETERDEQKQEQHGWIVGGNHKKVVTMLVTNKSKKGDGEIVDSS